MLRCEADASCLVDEALPEEVKLLDVYRAHKDESLVIIRPGKENFLGIGYAYTIETIQLKDPLTGADISNEAKEAIERQAVADFLAAWIATHDGVSFEDVTLEYLDRRIVERNLSDEAAAIGLPVAAKS